MITPKEKALELFLKFRQIPPSSPYTGVDDDEAKQCAIVAVDEILDIDCCDMSEEHFNNHIEYWQEVKSELEKL